MEQHQTNATRQSLKEVHDLFEEWRSSRNRGSKIPEDLWKAAVSLTESHSLNQISQSLRVEYNQLRKRVERYRSIHNDENPCTAGSMGFVELSVSPTVSGSECVIELERSDGARMRMSLKGSVNHQLVEIAKAFWRL